MEKKDLLQKTQDLIRQCQPKVHDPLLQAGVTVMQKNVLNYYRADLDYPSFSAKNVVSLLSCMLLYMDIQPFDVASDFTLVLKSFRELLDLWSTQLKG